MVINDTHPPSLMDIFVRLIYPDFKTSREFITRMEKLKKAEISQKRTPYYELNCCELSAFSGFPFL